MENREPESKFIKESVIQISDGNYTIVRINNVIEIESKTDKAELFLVKRLIPQGSFDWFIIGNSWKDNSPSSITSNTVKKCYEVSQGNNLIELPVYKTKEEAVKNLENSEQEEKTDPKPTPKNNFEESLQEIDENDFVDPDRVFDSSPLPKPSVNLNGKPRTKTENPDQIKSHKKSDFDRKRKKQNYDHLKENSITQRQIDDSIDEELNYVLHKARQMLRPSLIEGNFKGIFSDGSISSILGGKLDHILITLSSTEENLSIREKRILISDLIATAVAYNVSHRMI